MTGKAADRMKTFSRRGYKADEREICIQTWSAGKPSGIACLLAWKGRLDFDSDGSWVRDGDWTRLQAAVDEIACELGLPTVAIGRVERRQEAIIDGEFALWVQDTSFGVRANVVCITGSRDRVGRMGCGFTRVLDGDGSQWWAVAPSVHSAFKGRGLVKAMYDAVERDTGGEVRPHGWNGINGRLGSGEIYALWKKRLARRGVDLDERLANLDETRGLLTGDELAALDSECQELLATSGRLVPAG